MGRVGGHQQDIIRDAARRHGWQVVHDYPPYDIYITRQGQSIRVSFSENSGSVVEALIDQDEVRRNRLRAVLSVIKTPALSSEGSISG